MRYLSILMTITIVLLAGCARNVYNTEPRTIEPETDARTIDKGFYSVTEETNLFEGADLGSRKLGKINAGEVVDVVDAAGAFAQIKYSDNAGWITDDEVEDTGVKNIVRTLGEVHVKASPDPRSDNILVLESGRLVTLKKRNGDWIYIKISENRGWILSGLLKPIGKVAETPKKPLSDRVYWQVLKKANLRSSPNVVSEILRLMPSGSSIVYLGTEGEWIRVEFDGTVGYVHEDLVAPY